MKIKKIGIYDKWLHTFGGGEKVATVMAEVLSQAGYQVDLISNFELEKTVIERKMGVNLTKVRLINWYERNYGILEPRTNKYDLFINISFLDHLPSQAKKSLYYVLFPTPVKQSLLGFVKYKSILPLLRTFLIIPEVDSGFTPVDDVYNRGGRWLNHNNTIVLHNVPSAFDLTLRVYAEELNQSSINDLLFSSPNSKITVRDKHLEHQFNIMVYSLHIESNQPSAVIKIKVNHAEKKAYGLVSITVKDLRFFLWNVLKRYLPRFEMALYGSSIYLPEEGLDTYDLFLADSAFSQYWTKRYLNKESEVLYPPVDVTEFKAGTKKNIILSVGRFFTGGHAKRQDILIEAFKAMHTSHQIPKNWELHLVGGVSQGQEHLDYLNQLQTQAKGFPIYFHISANYQTLKKLYAQAKIYWHATGYGIDENKEPIRTEHFGITPVEAMAAGVVPLIYKAGGVVEVVEGSPDLLWKTQTELIRKTRALIEHPAQLRKKSQLMRKRAQFFSKAQFIKALKKYVKELSL